ncbi:MAG TPA: glycosyl hydrolase, partial [Candidatus Dormibacteraeota bacterium]|nr:glycosyl hydrolase [Candidatus Dormibacteraeota bacterium]
AVGALAVAASDPQVLYVGTGEACPRNDVIHGDGVYRSTDGGRSWEPRGLEATRHIARVRVDPRNPERVYVAALGDVFGPSPHRGVYRSEDGGAQWALVLPGGDQAGAADLWMAPGNPRLLFATLWEARRFPWGFSSGGAGSGLYRSTDGGDSWTNLDDRPGLPRSVRGRMGVAATPSRPDRVWALIEAGDGQGGLYRSENGGESWARISEERALLGRPWYYSHIVPDPQDPETLYAMNYNFWRSVDGGGTWTRISTPHGDNHDLWIDPVRPQRMIEANDGGACVSFNGGQTFSTIHNQPTGAFYKMAVDHRFPYRVYGTQQDNSAVRVPSRSRSGAIPWAACEVVGHSESGFIAVDPRDDDIVYSGAVGSSGGGGAPLLRYDHRTRESALVTVWPEWTYAEDPSGWRHRFAWTYPIVLSRHDPAVLYAAGECVFRSLDEGRSWAVISPDLSRNDPEKLRAAGGPITKDTSGAEVYCTVASLAESPQDPAVLWAGTDDGRLHRTEDGGVSWTEVPLPGLPAWAWITGIELSPHHPGTVYVAATRYRLQDRTPYLFRSADGGRSWERITRGIGAEDWVRVVRTAQDHPGLVFAGTEAGPYASRDGGDSWEPLRLNLPVVPVYDLAVKDADLVVATHGRGFWVLDDACLLADLPEDPSATPARLLVPAAAYRYLTGEGPVPTETRTQYRETATAVVDHARGGGLEAVVLDAGVNPPDGVTIRYHLREAVDPAALTLRILDRAGTEIASFGGRPAAAAPDRPAPDPETEEDAPAAVLPSGPGWHRFAWNLRARGARLRNVVLRQMPSDEPGRDSLEAGPVVPPGSYRIELTANDALESATVEVRPDPNARATARDYAGQFQLLLRVRDTQVAVNAGIERCQRLRAQAAQWHDRRDGGDAVRTAAQAVLDALGPVEGSLTQPRWRAEIDDMEFPAGLDGRLCTLTEAVAAATAAPTAQAQAVASLLADRAQRALGDLERVEAGPVAAFNAAVGAAGLPALEGRPPD